jgi:para-aminobenzoate synthetase/4-amino-4-deoxychorismate lyase
MLPFDTRGAFVWLEDSRGPALAGPSWLFTGLVEDETAADGDIRAALARLKAWPDWTAGWLAYEAGYALEAKLQDAGTESGNPLMWFGRFQSRQMFDPHSVEAVWRYPLTTALAVTTPMLTPNATDDLHYKKAVARILDYIAAGDVYQINFTYPLIGETALDPVRLYRHLRESQRVPYGALIHDGKGNWILSFSPELFFRIDENIITAKPMKGTARRLPLLADDRQAAAELQADTKNRAENLMIVDLLRNDISKIAKLGSVAVPSLYDIETYTTVHQLTSTVTAQLTKNTHATDVLAALFPCGSVTGAPKIRAMEIIRALEPGPRGVYCGALGWIGPEGDAMFNVPIRTLALSENKTIFGLGSGIVADSNPADEWQECQLKGQFIRRAMPPFDLFETLLWQPAYGWWELDAHLDRLSDSADYWGFPVNRQKWQEDLSQVAASFKMPMRVRLLLGRSGAISIQSALLIASPDQPVKLAISPSRMRSDNPFLYHKTTHRAFYDDERQRLARETGCLECLFLNERDEVTEGSFTTLFIRKNGKLLTPTQSCGLLPGILRQKLIDEEGCTETILTLDDIKSADTLLIGNSVRGLLGANLV